jgi:undecaprenyl-diphosphatase
LLAALLLGVLQGLTEFLPVSSSGHLVLFQQWLHVPGDEVLFDLVCHLGTLAPVVFFYRRSLLDMLRAPFVEKGPLSERPSTRLILLLGLATVPTGLIGVLFKDFFEQLFATPGVLAITFAITGTLLFASRYARQGSIDPQTMLWWQALALGVAQGMAITPGISRSGTTIAVALFLGLSREYAARFSFLMSIPAILGAFVLKSREADLAQLDFGILGVGAIASLISGYFALVLLVKLVKSGDFSKFSFYAWGMALFAGAGALLGWFG